MDYKKVIEIDEIEAVVITSARESHIPIAIEAMKAGKTVGMEVGGERPTVQLVDVEVKYGKYKSNFTKFLKWVDMCGRCGVKYF